MSALGARRPRVANSCRECKRRKLKCDQTRPACSRCNGTPGAECVYGTEEYRPREFHFVGTGLSDPSLRPGLGRAQAPDSMAISSEKLEKLEERIEHLAGLVQDLQSSRATETNASVISEELYQSSKRTRQSIPLNEPHVDNAGHLDVQIGGRTRYVSKSHWAGICEETNEIELLVRSQTRYDISPASIESGSISLPLRQTLLSSTPAWDPSTASSSKFRQKVSSYLIELPEKPCCDALFEAYVYNFHPVVPLTHIPSLRKDYTRFWEVRQSGNEGCLDLNAPLIIAALYAGAVACSVATFEAFFESQDREVIASALHQSASKALHLAHFPKVPTVQSLSAYLIVQGTWMRDEEPLVTCGFVGIAVRVAQMLGLHKDPSQYMPRISISDAEIRRRVWWHVFHIDLLVAMASGLPPLINRGSWDTLMVSELREEQIGTSAGLQYESDIREGRRDSDEPGNPLSFTSPMGIWLCGKMEETLAARSLMDAVFGHPPIAANDTSILKSELVKLEQNIFRRVKRIPYQTEHTTYEDNETFNYWARILLSALGDKNWWFMHSPLLHRAMNQACMLVTPSVERHSCAFLQKFLWIACGEDFHSFQWAWPGNHQPLHAIMILLKEVERDPFGVNAEASRNIVDQAIALCNSDGGISGSNAGYIMARPLTEGGQEAWDFIRRLRARAWMKAGLDPDVVMVREEVLQTLREQVEDMKSVPMPDYLLPLEPAEVPIEMEPSTQAGTFSGYPGVGSALTTTLSWDDWDTFFGNFDYLT